MFYVRLPDYFVARLSAQCTYSWMSKVIVLLLIIHPKRCTAGGVRARKHIDRTTSVCTDHTCQISESVLQNTPHDASKCRSTIVAGSYVIVTDKVLLDVNCARFVHSHESTLSAMPSCTDGTNEGVRLSVFQPC